jgi:hypothetical protein
MLLKWNVDHSMACCTTTLKQNILYTQTIWLSMPLTSCEAARAKLYTAKSHACKPKRNLSLSLGRIIQLSIQIIFILCRAAQGVLAGTAARSTMASLLTGFCGACLVAALLLAICFVDAAGAVFVGAPVPAVADPVEVAVAGGGADMELVFAGCVAVAAIALGFVDWAAVDGKVHTLTTGS